MVMLSDTSLNCICGDISFSDGIATFMLKHGQSGTAFGLPAGAHCSVSEQSANKDGYSTVATGSSGTITANETMTAVFVNTKDAADVPKTGDNSHLALWMLLAVVSLLGMAVFGKRIAGPKNNDSK